MQFANRAQLEHHLGQTIAEAVALLLSTKHLYQHVAVEAIPKGLAGDPGAPPHVERYVPEEELRVMWWPEVTDPRTGVLSGAAGLPYLRFEVPPVKLFCSVCARAEPYNPFRSLAHSQPYTESFSPHAGAHEMVQVFVFHYQCQSCRGTPETFLIRRDGLKLTLCGRSPIEHVHVPDFIPKKQRRFYSDAIVAYQCKHTLEALFMLRTLVEQFACERSPGETLADRAIDAYMGRLPGDLSDRLPSLRKLYEDLSTAIHAARADVKLFEQVLKDLNAHFDIRRVHKLP